MLASYAATRRWSVLPLSATLACGMALALAACGDAGAPAEMRDPATVPEGERYGGTAVLPMVTGIETMNPLAVTDYGSQVILRSLLFTPLVGYDAELNPAPGIAERWDTVRVAPDTLALTFHLRRDLRWHDGAPVTAEDVLFTFERMIDPRTAFTGVARLARYAPRAELLDRWSIRFRLRPHPEFLEVWFLTPPLPRHLLADVPPEELHRHPFGTRNPVGSGPFRFVRHTPGQEWVFEANLDYPEALGGRPYLDRVVYRQIPDQTTLLTEVLTGRLDLAGIRPEHLERVRASPHARVLSFPLPQWAYIAWNTRLPQFRDPRVRRALTLALDREAIVEGVLYGVPEPGRSVVPPSHWAYAGDDPEVALGHDLEEARRLLAEAGWRDRDGDGVLEDAEGNRMRFTMITRQGNDSWREITEIAQARFAALGVAVRPRVLDGATLVRALQGTVGPDGRRQRDFEAVVLNWVEGFGRDDSFHLHSRSRDEPHGFTGYANPRADWLMDTLAVTMDREAARPLWLEYQRLLAREAPYTVLYYGRPLVAVSRRLQGVEMDPRGSLASVARWWILED